MSNPGRGRAPSRGDGGTGRHNNQGSGQGSNSRRGYGSQDPRNSSRGSFRGSPRPARGGSPYQQREPNPPFAQNPSMYGAGSGNLGQIGAHQHNYAVQTPATAGHFSNQSSLGTGLYGGTAPFAPPFNYAVPQDQQSSVPQYPVAPQQPHIWPNQYGHNIQQYAPPTHGYTNQPMASTHPDNLNQPAGHSNAGASQVPPMRPWQQPPSYPTPIGPGYHGFENSHAITQAQDNASAQAYERLDRNQGHQNRGGSRCGASLDPGPYVQHARGSNRHRGASRPGGSERLCHECYQPGHFQRNCPNRHQNNDSPRSNVANTHHQYQPGANPSQKGDRSRDTVPRELLAPPLVPNLDHRRHFSGEDQKHRFEEAMKASKLSPMPLRSAFALEDRQDAVVYTNHFPIELPSEEMYEYKMEGIVTLERRNEETIPNATRRQELMKEAVRKSQILHNAGGTFATDGIEKIVAWKPLPKDDDSSVIENINIEVSAARGHQAAVNRDVQLKYFGPIPIDQLRKECSGNINTLPLNPKGATGMTVIEAINIIIGFGARNSVSRDTVRTLQLSANKFFSANTNSESTIDLGNGLRCHKGFFFTLRHGMGKPLLNVSSAATAFYKAGISVARIMHDFCIADSQDRTKLTASDLKNLRAALEGVTVRIQHENRTRTITDIADLDMVPTNKTFRDEHNAQWNVHTYLAHHRSTAVGTQVLQSIEASEYPCIIFGRDSKARHFPAETLFIVENQPLKGKAPPEANSKMIEEARELPLKNRKSICSSGFEMLSLRGQPASILSAAGVSVEPNMVTVPARHAARPSITYGNNGSVSPKSIKESVQWNLKNQVFLQQGSHSLARRVMLLVPQCSSIDATYTNATDGSHYTSELMRKFLTYGHTSKDPQYPGAHITTHIFAVKDGKDYGPDFVDIFDKNQRSNSPADLAVLLSPKKRGLTDAFSDFKRIAETRYGLHTICMAAKALYDAANHQTADGQHRSQLGPYLANMTMKVNLKLGHINHSFALVGSLSDKISTRPTGCHQQERGDTMILGGDVTHPLKGSADPSIAAIVGSVDDHLAKYLGSVRYQSGGTEIIEDAESMFEDRIRAWYDHQECRLPSNIIYYRDGVGNSMYDKVLKQEVSKIEAAFTTVKTAKSGEMAEMGIAAVTAPKITVVIVTKRHHTRFYPDSSRSSQNCPASTVVESGVTHPCYFDFYLQSHTPVQGTARPTYYIVIRNDIDFTVAEIQDLTNGLCYSYARCTLPVGYAPPAYYADRLCEQVRLYIKREAASVLQNTGGEPQRPVKPENETVTQRSTRISSWQKGLELWKKDVTAQWKLRHTGLSYKGVRSNGPWHAKLNDTMFWM